MTNKKGYIYKLCSTERDDLAIYIGSTSRPVNQRRKEHKYGCSNNKQKRFNFPVYKFIREFGGFEKWKMEVLETVDFESKIQLKRLERDFIDKALKMGVKLLNKDKPLRELPEWRRDNPEKCRIYALRSRMKNREKQNAARQASYYNNKEVRILSSRLYYQKNKDKINLTRGCKVKCLCGMDITKRSLKKHLNTKRHKENSKLNLCQAVEKVMNPIEEIEDEDEEIEIVEHVEHLEQPINEGSIEVSF